MLRITVELIPHGCEQARHVIAKGEIFNDGTGDLERGNYHYAFCRVGGKSSDGKTVTGYVSDFGRLDKSALHLIAECLSDGGFLE